MQRKKNTGGNQSRAEQPWLPRTVLTAWTITGLKMQMNAVVLHDA